jgi:SAM-dependent methyltransferase
VPEPLKKKEDMEPSSEEVNTNEWMQPYFAPNVQSEIFRWWGWVGRDLITRQFPGGAGESINALEFGCGEAANVNFFREQGLQSFGVDLNPESLAVGLERWPSLDGRLSAIPFECDELPFGDTRFHVITSRHVLHFLTPLVFERTLSVIRNRMLDGGVLFITFMKSGGFYFNNSQPLDNGMRRVTFNNGRFERNVDVWFVNDEDELRSRFPGFTLHEVGEQKDYFTRAESPGDTYFCATLIAD